MIAKVCGGRACEEPFIRSPLSGLLYVARHIETLPAQTRSDDLQQPKFTNFEISPRENRQGRKGLTDEILNRFCGGDVTVVLASGLRCITLVPMPTSNSPTKLTPGPAPWQQRWYEVIFEADTPAGKAFDVALLVVILMSLVTVMLESVHDEPWLQRIEWVITVLFSLEFLARLACVAKPSCYVWSFFGIVDLLALLPTYLGLFFRGTHVLATIRTLRLLRVFRIFNMGQHVTEANTLLIALKRAWTKITVFLSVIFCAIVILGTVMYLIERDAGSGFDNIPRSIYWAIVTMTTVGYGNIAPSTLAGQTLAALVMLFGYAIIIVPTGIFTAEVMSQGETASKPRECPNCSYQEHNAAAKFCCRCGKEL